MFLRIPRFAPPAGVVLAALVALVCPAADAQDTLIGLNTNNQLFRFQSNAAFASTDLNGVANAVTAVTGLQSGDFLRSIDFRPSNGLLYGLTSNGTTLRLYTLNTTTGAATLQSTLTPAPGNNGSGTVTPATPFTTNQGYTMDFNPVDDSLRFASGDAFAPIGNYRITAANLLTGITFSDAPIVFPTFFDLNVQGIAFSNNIAGATSTTLYDVVVSRELSDNLMIQGSPSPNDGTLNLPPGTNRGNIGGFLSGGDLDISGVTGNAYYGGGISFKQVNLTTGQTSGNVFFNSSTGNVRGIAVVPTVAVAPEPGTFCFLGFIGLSGGVVVRRRQSVGAC
jgi:hypothetical protein